MSPEDILDSHSSLKAYRSNFEPVWQEIADRVWPQMADINTKRTPGDKRTEKVFDSTAMLALDKFAAACHSLISPDNQQYQKLVVKDTALREDHAINVYLEDLTEVLFAARRSSKSNFSSQANECYKSLGAFGNLGMFVDDMVGKSIIYKSIHMAELFYSENRNGVVDYVHRAFEYTARQAVEAFGIDKVAPKIKQCYEKRDENSKFEFIHCVRPNPDIKPGRIDASGMAFSSYYVSVEGKLMMEEGGYRTFPYAISRYSTNPREVYGRGPAGQVLPDIKMINEQEKTRLRAGHLAVDPPLLLFEDGSLQGFQMRPRALNFGGVDSQGRQMVQPLQTGANLPWATELLEERRKLINDAFLVTLFQILVETPTITATEALLRAQEKGTLLAPVMGRQQSEFLGRVTERELDILEAAGQLPEMPPELMEMGGLVEIEYTSPLSRLLRSEDGVAILRSFEALAPWAEVNPDVFDVFDDATLPMEVAEIYGVPKKVLRSKEALAAFREQKAMQRQAEALVAAAPQAASAAKDLAQAAQIGGAAMPNAALGA